MELGCKVEGISTKALQKVEKQGENLCALFSLRNVREQYKEKKNLKIPTLGKGNCKKKKEGSSPYPCKPNLLKHTL